MEIVEVNLGARSYPIYIGADLLANQDLIRRQIRGSQVAVITNETVAPLYLDVLQAGLGDLSADVYELPDGEEHKTLASYAAVMDFLIAQRHNRSTTLIALGGGVVGDICGFVAATFQRGVEFVQIPTTLLAQVDSSVGGKTAVNHAAGKNLIGAFYQPRCVLADTSVLSTLGDREFSAGLAEVLKYGVIHDADFFAWVWDQAQALTDRSPQALSHAVRRSCEIKADVVSRDERESGVRATLNFGHTFGHALEALTEYKVLLHGEAVAIGMVMAADLSNRLGWLSVDAAQRIKQAVVRLGLPVCPPVFPAEEMLQAMGMDKKVLDGRLRLVLAKNIGEVVICDDFAHGALLATLTAGESLCDG
jgi:3-dehydroquinate synthase